MHETSLVGELCESEPGFVGNYNRIVWTTLPWPRSSPMHFLVELKSSV